MPRSRKSTTPKTSTNTFVDALKFCALALKDHGAINETHVHIKDGWITAFNGVLAVGHKCNEDIHACPQIKLAIEALSKCGQNIAITQLDNSQLSIKSDKFKAIVPCINVELLTVAKPDEKIAIIDDRLKEALTIAGELPDENGNQIYNMSVLLNGTSIVSAMAGSFILEYWHGIDLPSCMVLPKALCTVLSKINKKLTHFGFSQWSITLYFEDDSWIRSQLYTEPWPNVMHVFDCKADLAPFPADFWTALAAVSPFTENGLVYASDGMLSSHADLNAGASYELPGYQGSGQIWCYPAKQLASLQAWATHCDFQAQGSHGAMLMAQGKTIRAVIAGVKQ